jgi:hypothetical protein
MLIAITGATGFIGSYTVQALHKAGHRVRALVRPTSRRDHIAPFLAEWREGDIGDPQSLAGLVAGAEVVIHDAADWDALRRSPCTNFDRNVRAASGQRLDVVAYFTADISGIDEIRGSTSARDGFLVRIRIHREDPARAGKACALNSAEADPAQAEHDDRIARLDVCRLDCSADPGRHAASRQTGPVKWGLLGNLGDRGLPAI